jgi:protein SCO1/2
MTPASITGSERMTTTSPAPPGAGRRRAWLAAPALALVALLVAGLYLHATRDGPAGTDAPEAAYRLLATDGRDFTSADFAGHPALLFFGFTHCPDVCPTTLAEIVGWYAALGREGDDLRAYFVTVDPARDTREVLAGYLGWTGRVTGLTGTPEEIAKATRAWGVYSQKVTLADGDYTMDHTASVLLVDRRGEVAGSIGFGESRDAALAKLRRLAAALPPASR